MKKLNWAATQRQNYIGERLRNVDTLNRFDLQKEFEISAPQASTDIAYYLKENPKTVRYDVGLKCYVYIGEGEEVKINPKSADYKAGFKAGMEWEAKNRVLTPEKKRRITPGAGR